MQLYVAILVLSCTAVIVASTSGGAGFSPLRNVNGNRKKNKAYANKRAAELSGIDVTARAQQAEAPRKQASAAVVSSTSLNGVDVTARAQQTQAQTLATTPRTWSISLQTSQLNFDRSVV